MKEILNDLFGDVRSWHDVKIFFVEVKKIGYELLGPIYFWIVSLVAIGNLFLCGLTLWHISLFYFIGYTIVTYFVLFWAVVALVLVRGLLKLLLGTVADIAGPGAAIVAGLALGTMVDVDFDGIDAVGDVSNVGLDTGGVDDVMHVGDSISTDHGAASLEDVSSYVRQDGTEVGSYVRTQADGIVQNNLGFRQ